MFWWKNPKRSKFGRWLDNEGITQVEFSEKVKCQEEHLQGFVTKKSTYLVHRF